MKKAARYTRDLLQHDPYHERALANQKYFQSLANEDSDKFNDAEEEQYVDPEHAKYEQLCRGDTEPIVSNYVSAGSAKFSVSKLFASIQPSYFCNNYTNLSFIVIGLYFVLYVCVCVFPNSHLICTRSSSVITTTIIATQDLFWHL